MVSQEVNDPLLKTVQTACDIDMKIPLLPIIVLFAELVSGQLPGLPNLNPLDLFYKNVPFASRSCLFDNRWKTLNIKINPGSIINIIKNL